MKKEATVTSCAGLSNSSPPSRPILKVAPGTKTIPSGALGTAGSSGPGATPDVASGEAAKGCDVD
ncbi:MAG: hypothetical protein JMDDDDMK_04309 [Acidobacteria bacterium]|nr:hypothetical protein [Acidobacteriota bacterium]